MIPALRSPRYWPNPGRLLSRLDCLSARFSFNDLLGFFAFCFFGDLSPMACHSIVVVGLCVGRVSESPNHSLVPVNTDRRGTAIATVLTQPRGEAPE